MNDAAKRCPGDSASTESKVCLLTEYPAPWAEWLRFETEVEGGRSVWRVMDPSLDQVFHDLVPLADQGDVETALALFEFVCHCQSSGNQRSAITEVPPPTWTEDQFLRWAVLASQAGSHMASMKLLGHAESLAIDDANRVNAAQAAERALLTTSADGWLESLATLASLYQHGTLIPKDLRRAFAYYQVTAAASVGLEASGFYWRLSGDLRARLKSADFEFAKQLQMALAEAIRARRGQSGSIG